MQIIDQKNALFSLFLSWWLGKTATTTRNQEQVEIFDVQDHFLVVNINLLQGFAI